uniref:Uncharacterized protein n=1 Tax=Eutreptiella gymnastica TaxID=73025 RepID=A0A7S4FKB7_9EUGL
MLSQELVSPLISKFLNLTTTMAIWVNHQRTETFESCGTSESFEVVRPMDFNSAPYFCFLLACNFNCILSRTFSPADMALYPGKSSARGPGDACGMPLAALSPWAPLGLGRLTAGSSSAAGPSRLPSRTLTCSATRHRARSLRPRW